MDVHVELGRTHAMKRSRTSTRTLNAGLKIGTLEDLFATLSKRHPDLAPILENATEQDDLEIYVNNHPIDAAQSQPTLHDGDTVSLFVKSFAE